MSGDMVDRRLGVCHVCDAPVDHPDSTLCASCRSEAEELIAGIGAAAASGVRLPDETAWVVALDNGSTFSDGNAARSRSIAAAARRVRRSGALDGLFTGELVRTLRRVAALMRIGVVV